MGFLIINYMTAIHKGSGGMAMLFPDTCKTPAPPAGPIPIPYPNMAQASTAVMTTTKVLMSSQPLATKSSKMMPTSGDEAGVAGGVASSMIKGEATFILSSMNVKVEGKPAVRAFDLVVSNKQNTPPGPVIQPVIPVLP